MCPSYKSIFSFAMILHAGSILLIHVQALSDAVNDRGSSNVVDDLINRFGFDLSIANLYTSLNSNGIFASPSSTYNNLILKLEPKY